MEIHTRRMCLRPLTLEQLIQGARTGDVGPLLGFPPDKMARDQKAFHRKIYSVKAALIKESPEAWLLCTYWQLIGLETRRLMGEAGFKGPPRLGEVELGYGTREAFRGQGYMTEAVDALCRFVFKQDVLPVGVVCATTEKDNLASHRVLQKCGFVRDGMRDGLLLWLRPGPGRPV